MAANKKIKCLVIYANETLENKAARKDIIAMYMNELGMSKAAASTYFQNAKTMFANATVNPLADTYTVHTKTGAEGIVRFNVLGRVIADDVLAAMNHDASVTHVDAYDYYTTRIIEQYTRARAERTQEQIDEERFEMMAAFGPGERVINVITGEVTQL